MRSVAALGDKRIDDVLQNQLSDLRAILRIVISNVPR